MQGHRDVLPLVLFPLGLRVLHDFRSFCCMKEFGDGSDGVTFPRLFISWRKLQVSPFTHCPLVSHCQQSPRILCTRCFCSLILDHGVLLKISISVPKILISNLLLDTSFHHSFQFCDNQVLTSSDESPSHTIPIRSEVSQTLVFLICTILPRFHHVGFSSWTIKYRPT